MKLQPGEQFWNPSLREIETRLEAERDGLTSVEARRRRSVCGPNDAQERAAVSSLREFGRRFENPLVLLLLAASLIMALTGDRLDCFIVMLIVLLSVCLDFVQERQASRAVESLRQSMAIESQVMRDGVLVRIAAVDLVPGDVIKLAAGDLIPVDARILTSKDFFVSQAVLTGEPYPLEKQPADLSGPTADLGDAINAVFSGGSVISGEATVLACRTGKQTEFGRIAASLQARRPATAFDVGIRRFGLLITKLTGLMITAVLLVNWALHRPFLESVLFGIALAVGLTPELLPMIITVTLSRGAVRMSKKQVIVKQLEAIQNLGSMDVLCTDKTGTLTQASIRLAGAVGCGGEASAQVLSLACLNSHFESGIRSALDEALLEQPFPQASQWRKIDEVPFDFERRRISVLIDDGAMRLLVVKGAPEDLLRLSDRWVGAGGVVIPMSSADREHLQALHDECAREGQRLLGVASREVSQDQSCADIEDERGLVFSGYVKFFDPPKEGAAEALRLLASSGVAVKVISGDNEYVTRHVCEAVGLSIQGLLTGAEVAQLDELALSARAEGVNVFCRIPPIEKSRIIRALRLRGHTVGYMGDGINDAPSLHVADIGISVSGAVDVAKAAAQVVLLQEDLRVLHEGVLEGRRTFANVRKYLLMATSSNFGNMFSMAGAALLLPFLPMLPVQILLNNFLYDISELALPFDRVDPQDLERPQRWDMHRILRAMWIIGPVSSLFDFLTFYIMLKWFSTSEAAFHTGWFIESIATQVLVIFIIRTSGSPWRSRCSPWLIASSLGVLVVALGLPFSALGAPLGLVRPQGSLIVALGVVVGAYLIMVQFCKQFLTSHPRPSQQ